VPLHWQSLKAGKKTGKFCVALFIL